MAPEAGITTHTSQRGLKYYQSGPTKSPVTLVCIHGWACRGSDFHTLFKGLQSAGSNFQSIAIALPGHDGSSYQDYPSAGMSTFAQATLDVMKELQLQNVVLAGHSMGCRVVVETFKRAQLITGNPQKIKGIIFLDGSYYPFRSNVFPFDARDPQSQTMSPEQKIKGMQMSFERMFTSTTPRVFIQSSVEHVRSIDLPYNLAMRASLIDYDFDEMEGALASLGKSGTPFLNFQATDANADGSRLHLKSGSRSRWMDFMQRLVPQAEQVVVEDSGHFPHIDQPMVVTLLIKEFVERVGSPSSAKL